MSFRVISFIKIFFHSLNDNEMTENGIEQIACAWGKQLCFRLVGNCGIFILIWKRFANVARKIHLIQIRLFFWPLPNDVFDMFETIH